MRELVYVSEAKLQQLLPDLPSGSKRLRDTEAEIKTPLGGFKVGKAAQESRPGLAAAVAILERSSRAPGWFADPKVRPGRWVHFEAPLSYGEASGAVVFLDVDQASAEYPSGGRVRLLLHGSRRHVVGTSAGGHDLRRHFQDSSWFAFLETMEQLEENDRKNVVDVEVGNRDYSLEIFGVVTRLTTSLQPNYTAAWMAGYARVTAVVPARSGITVLAATPLYVEYIDPPGDSVEPGR